MTRNRLGGTLPYMAPEQLRALGNVLEQMPGPAADVFSFGVIAHQLLCGRHPFAPVPAPGPTKKVTPLLLARHAAGPDSLTQANPRVDAALAGLLRRCLDLDPQVRPTAAELAAALKRRPAPRRDPRHRLRRPRFALAAAALLIFATLSAAARQDPERARQEEAQRLYEHGRAQVIKAKAEGRPPAAAVRFFEESDRLNPSGRAQAALAYCRALLREHDRAVQACQLVLEQYGADQGVNKARLLNLRGYARLQMYEKDHDSRTEETLRAATKDFQDALGLDPDLRVAHYNLALLALRRALLPASGFKVPEEALEHMRQAVRLSPPSLRLSYDAARLFALACRTRPELAAEALDHLEQAVKNGFDLSRLRPDPTDKLVKEPLFQPLTKHARYQNLLRAEQRKPLASPELRLLDPVAAD
jgi:tetratricopeptide (TPR) repeat protein